MVESKKNDYTKQLEIIEEFLKAPVSRSGQNINETITKLFQTFQNLDEKTQFFRYLSFRGGQKQIYLVRHAESEYNSWRKQSIFNLPWFYPNAVEKYDPPITKLGITQCQQLKEKLNKLNQVQFDLVLVSPLKRAIQTFIEVKECQVFSNCKQYFVSDLIREQLDTACDIGRDVNKVKEEFQNYLSFDYFKKSEEKEVQRQSGEEIVQKIPKEGSDELQTRGFLLLIWILLRDQYNICLFSHNNSIKSIKYSGDLIKKGTKNANYVQLQPEDIDTLLSKYKGKY